MRLTGMESVCMNGIKYRLPTVFFQSIAYLLSFFLPFFWGGGGGGYWLTGCWTPNYLLSFFENWCLKVRKYGCEHHHFMSSMISIWCRERDWHVWQKCIEHQKPIFHCSSLVESKSLWLCHGEIKLESSKYFCGMEIKICLFSHFQVFAWGSQV